jgi:two-component sensor histidine kinase
MPDAAGAIEIIIRNVNAGRMEIMVADDGIGFAGLPAEADKQSLGLRLIDTLTNQLDGTLAVATENGTRFSIILKVPQHVQKES